MGSCILQIGQRVAVVSDDAPSAAEFALFDAADIELAQGEAGVVREAGYRTTAVHARRRLDAAGVTNELIKEATDLLRPALASHYARGPYVRRVLAKLGAAELFEGRSYDSTLRRYAGGWLHLPLLANDAGLASGTSLFQALSLAAMLDEVDEITPVVFDTRAAAALPMRLGERAARKRVLDGVDGLPRALRILAEKGTSPEPMSESDGVSKAEILAQLRARIAAATDPKRDRIIQIARALERRDPPVNGPLADPEMWAVEQRLVDGNADGAAEWIDSIERAHGRTPGTIYLRAKASLIARRESPRAIAERVSALVLSMNEFAELELLAAQAWLAAGEPRRALPYARDLASNPKVHDELRLAAEEIITPPRSSPPRSAPPATTRSAQGSVQDSIQPQAQSMSGEATYDEDDLAQTTPVAQSRAAPPPRLPSPPPRVMTPEALASTPEVPPTDFSERGPAPRPQASQAASASHAAPPLSLTPPPFPSPQARSDPPPPLRTFTPPDASLASDAIDARAISPEPPRAIPPVHGSPPRYLPPVQSPPPRSIPPFIESPPRSVSPPGSPPLPSSSAYRGEGVRESVRSGARSGVPGRPGSDPAATVRPSQWPTSMRAPREESYRPEHVDHTPVSARPLATRFMRGASLPPHDSEPPPRAIPKAPIVPRVDPEDAPKDAPIADAEEHPKDERSHERRVERPNDRHGKPSSDGALDHEGRVTIEEAEVVETLSLPAAAYPEMAENKAIPRTPLEARVRCTLWARELARQYRVERRVVLRLDGEALNVMQQHLRERFPSHLVRTPEEAHEAELHGALLSELLARTLDADWADIAPSDIGYWAMTIPARGTAERARRVWPFGRVLRLIAGADDDLAAYYRKLRDAAR